MTSPAPAPDICTSCGGSGVRHTTHGPFYAKLSAKQRALVAGHIRRRHDILKLIDRDVARQVIQLHAAKVKPGEVLPEMVVTLDSAAELWDTDLIGSARALVKVLRTVVWALESIDEELDT